MSFLGIRLRRQLAVSLAIVCLAVGATAGAASAAPANVSHGSHVSHFVCDYICFAPYVVIEDTNGDIVTTFMGVGLVPLAHYQITLTLTASCQNNLDGQVLTADLNGRINAVVYGGPAFFPESQPCAPTRYYGFAQLLQTPFTTYAHYLKILSPRP